MTYFKQEFDVTKSEGLALVSRSERERAHWCLSVRLDARVMDKPDCIYQDGLASYLNISRAQASSLIENLLPDTLEAKGARIHIRKVQHRKDSRAVYWITQ
jgi:hypothetical protein